jgi:hypothetical protein
MPVSNKPSGAEFRVYKKDSDGKPLQGAKFVIKNKEELQSNKQNNGQDQKNISGSNNLASAASEPNISKWFKYFVK